MTIERVKLTPLGSEVYRDGVLYETRRNTVEGSESNIVGSVGGGLLQSATVTLNDAQIKALPTMSQAILAAQVVGKVVLFIAGYILLDHTAGDYANVDSTAILEIKDQCGSVGSTASVNFTQLGIFNLVQEAPLIVDPASWIVSGKIVPIGGPCDNSPITVSAHNGVLGDFTGGNSANTLKIALYYVVVSI